MPTICAFSVPHVYVFWASLPSFLEKAIFIHKNNFPPENVLYRNEHLLHASLLEGGKNEKKNRHCYLLTEKLTNASLKLCTNPRFFI